MSKNLTPINSLNQNFDNTATNSDILSNFNSQDTQNFQQNDSTENNRFGFLKSKKFLISILISALLLVFIGLFWYFFFKSNSFNKNSLLIKSPTVKNGSSQNTSTDTGVTSKEYVNPINGVYLSKDNYQLVTSRKPVSVMLNNHVDARPQAGISMADIIYEISAEGGISRLMPIFHSQIPDKVGSVRSARIYFMQVAAEYNPIFSHWGVAYRPDYEKNLSDADFAKLLASGQAETDPRADARSYGDEIALPVANTDTTPDLFYRENLPVAIEHTGFAKLSNVYTEFVKFYPEKSWSDYQEVEMWDFKSDTSFRTPGAKINKISFNFWDFPGFETTWEYIAGSNTYKRTQGGVLTVDRNTNKQVEVVNLIIQKANETRLNDKKGHLLYDVIGSGDATVYMDGVKILAKWEKPSARERTKFKDLSGNPIEFNRGLTWVVILPTDSVVTEQ